MCAKHTTIIEKYLQKVVKEMSRRGVVGRGWFWMLSALTDRYFKPAIFEAKSDNDGNIIKQMGFVAV